MSRLFQKSASDHSVSVSGPEEEDIKKRKEVKGSSSLIPKKDKKEKKAKEKETRYAHLGDDSTGEDELEGK